MGLLKEPAGFVAALNLPKGFSVCELGDQMMDGKVAGGRSEPFYRALGCGRYVSIDGNGAAALTADLNLPLTAALGTFDLVTDFGTGEHIFNQAQVWQTMHALAKPGGYIAFDRPSQGYERHCFYLVDECLFVDLAEANHYRVVRLTQGQTPEGTLVRGIYQLPVKAKAFCVPQQGRYRRTLHLPEPVREALV